MALINSYITDSMAAFPQELELVGRNYSIVQADLGVIAHITEPVLLDHSYNSSYKGLKVPFNLSINYFDKFKDMLDKDITLIDAVNVMIAPPIAESTLKIYTPVVKKFELFCDDKSYPFPYFSEPTVLHFLAETYKENQSFSFYGKILPSLKALELVLSVKNSAITDTVKAALNSLKRKVASTRKPVKKAVLFDVLILNKLIGSIILPHQEELYKIKASEFRAVVRGIVIYYSFCRFSDYTQLLDTDLDDQGSHIVISFKKSKNDQYYEGSTSFISSRSSEFCLVKILRLYYQRFQLRFKGHISSGKFVNFRVEKRNGYHATIVNTKLGVSSATDQMRALLIRHGYPGKSYTEKSFKVGGVTALCDSGEGLENVMVAGRWRNLYTPMHYRNTSVNFRLNIVQNLPC